MKSTNYPNKIAWCKFCDQGWLEIIKEIATGEFSIVCSECDTQYVSPEDAIHSRNGDLYKGGRAIAPDIEEITAIGWDKYMITNETK